MSDRELWAVTLVLERDPHWQAAPSDWEWSQLLPTRIEDMCATFMRSLSDDDETSDRTVLARPVDEPLTSPLSQDEINQRAATDPQGMVHALIAVEFSDLVDHDADWLLAELGARAFGRPVDFCFDIVDVDGSDLLLDVHADPAPLLDDESPVTAEGA